MIAFDGLMFSDTPCFYLSKSLIDTSSLAKISFFFSLKTPNYLQRQSSQEKRAQHFSYKWEVFSISASSFACNLASFVQTLSSFSYKDSFCLSTWFFRETISKENRRSYENAYNHLGSPQGCTWDSTSDNNHNNQTWHSPHKIPYYNDNQHKEETLFCRLQTL